MPETNFQPIFEYMDERFKDVRDDISKVRKDVRQLKVSVDSVIRTVKNHTEEIIVINHRLDKLEAKTF